MSWAPGRRCIGRQPEQLADLNDLEDAADFFFPELRAADAPDVELEDMILASADLSGADSDTELLSRLSRLSSLSRLSRVSRL